MLFFSGQGAVDEEGRPVHTGDMRAQLIRTMDNLETVLRGAGLGLPDVDGLWGEMDAVGARFGGSENLPAGTMVGVTQLAYPEMLVEIEATAAA